LKELTSVKKKYLTLVFLFSIICFVMDKIIEKNMLYDFYGELLTEHQKTIYEEAVFGDYSLSELSETYGITRQGIHDLLKRCDKILNDYESKLHLVEKFKMIRKNAEEIELLCGEIDSENSVKIKELTTEIIKEL